MQPKKVVIHFKDGRILKGSADDFSPSQKEIRFKDADGRTMEVGMEELKALFFVRDLLGDKHYAYAYHDIMTGGGRKILVSFIDGETIIGYVLGYSPETSGFIMTPADSKGNNDRIYVVKSATKRIDFLSREEKRRYHRAEAVKLISYEGFHVDGHSFEQGMGKTLDISQGGILIESQVPVKSKHILITAMNAQEEVINIKGKVIYSREAGPKIFHSGIRFMDTNEKNRKIVMEIIKAFLQEKNIGNMKSPFSLK